MRLPGRDQLGLSPLRDLYETTNSMSSWAAASLETGHSTGENLKKTKHVVLILKSKA